MFTEIKKAAYLKERHYSYLSAYAGFLLFAVAFPSWFIVCNFLPPVEPNWSAERIAQFYTDNQTRILAGCCAGLMGLFFYILLYGVISQILEEQYNAPLAAKLQLIGAIMGGMFFYFSYMFPAFAAYRPERDPAITQLLNDCTWFFTWWTTSCVMVQYAAMAVPILISKGTVYFPRWFGWFSAWASIAAVLGSLIPMFKVGPFAYDGALQFWFAVPGYVALVGGTSVATVIALRNTDKELGIQAKPI